MNGSAIEKKSGRTVAICVSTFQRPIELHRLLASLNDLDLERHPEIQARVIVVDNDAAGHALQIIDELSPHFRFPLVGVIEPRAGISCARNASVAAAGVCDLVAFVDDDEVVDRLWLSELLSAMERFGADIVSGPVIARFEAPLPEWIVRGGLFDRPRSQTGDERPHAATNNLLIPKALLDAVPGPFDERFAFTGGEDTLLTMTLRHQGARIVWCDEATVTEIVTEDRATARWILRRAFRRGTTMSRCERIVDPSPRAGAARAGKALGKIALGLAVLPICVSQGRVGVIGSLRESAYGLGLIAGLLGYRYNEYKRR